jgi:hypothetical protein
MKERLAMQNTHPEQRPIEPTGGSVRATKSEARSPLAALLDRVIVIMMVAILLTLSWPVSMVLWHQSRPALPAIHSQARDVP